MRAEIIAEPGLEDDISNLADDLVAIGSGLKVNHSRRSIFLTGTADQFNDVGVRLIRERVLVEEVSDMLSRLSKEEECPDDHSVVYRTACSAMRQAQSGAQPYDERLATAIRECFDFIELTRIGEELARKIESGEGEPGLAKRTEVEEKQRPALAQADHEALAHHAKQHGSTPASVQLGLS